MKENFNESKGEELTAEEEQSLEDAEIYDISYGDWSEDLMEEYRHNDSAFAVDFQTTSDGLMILAWETFNGNRTKLLSTFHRDMGVCTFQSGYPGPDAKRIPLEQLKERIYNRHIAFETNDKEIEETKRTQAHEKEKRQRENKEYKERQRKSYPEHATDVPTRRYPWGKGG